MYCFWTFLSLYVADQALGWEFNHLYTVSIQKLWFGLQMSNYNVFFRNTAWCKLSGLSEEDTDIPMYAFGFQWRKSGLIANCDTIIDGVASELGFHWISIINKEQVFQKKGTKQENMGARMQSHVWRTAGRFGWNMSIMWQSCRRLN